MKFSTKAVLIASIALLTSYCSHRAVREPASEKKVFTDNETRALAEIFGGDSPLNSYRHKMTVRFQTDGDKEYLATTARKALNEAIVETLGVENPEQGLAKLAAGNLKDALIENFIKTLRVYKIFDTGLQLDLMFLPEMNQKNDYSSELNSNQLVRLSETGGLTKKWERLEKFTTTGTLYNNSVYVPLSQGDPNYLGGSVTLFVKIMDVGIGIPKIRKNAVKGFVRYRRYYRVIQNPQTPVTCGDYTLSLKSPGAGVPTFYTMDLYKNFNLKNLVPTEETLEVFPGALVTHNEGRSELIAGGLEKSGPGIVTGLFTVESKNPSNQKLSFKLKKIVYDLKSRDLDRRRTLTELVSYSPQFESEANPDGTQATLLASHSYLKKCEGSMKKFMNIESLVEGGLL